MSLAFAERLQSLSMRTHTTFDVAVVGAGVFGVWTAYQLRRAGANVVLLDAYGPGNSRASSGGESRIMRMGYGPDDIYTQSARRSLTMWQAFFELIEPPTIPSSQRLFRQTGVLWLAQARDLYCEATRNVLQHLSIQVEKLDPNELQQRYSQFDFTGVAWALLEPESGALLARRAVQAVASQTKADGTTIWLENVLPPAGRGRLNSISTSNDTPIIADKFVFCCGPWLPKLFPEVLGEVIHVTRQEVFFFGVPAGDQRFSPERMPIWIDFNELIYAIPDLENRGLKIAIDAHGPDFDPDTGERVVTAAGLNAARAYLRKRIPSLATAPLTESRVCQYENTSNGDFLIDRHPHFENVWLVGGGSGHGFKHGPAVAEYVVSMITGSSEAEARFALSSKGRVHQRQVY
jgi:monomeric sarcosine oxidase